MKRNAALITAIVAGLVLVVFASGAISRHGSSSDASTVRAAARAPEEPSTAADDADAQQSGGQSGSGSGQQQPTFTSNDPNWRPPDDRAPAAKTSSAIDGNASMHWVNIDDPHLRMPAAAIMIPAGWKFNGTVAHIGGCHGNGAGIQYNLQSPDGLTAVELYPNFVWNNTGQPSQSRNVGPRIAQMYRPRPMCAPLDIDSAPDFMQRIVVPGLRPWAIITNIEPPPQGFQQEIDNRLQQLEQQAQQQAARFRQAGFPAGNHPDQHMLEGAIAYVTYNLNGQPVDEIMKTAIHCRASWQPGNYVATPSVNVNCNSWPVVVMRAPRGHLAQNIRMLVAIEKSLTINPSWDYTMGEIIRIQGQELLQWSNAQFQAMMQNSQIQEQIRTAQHNAYMQQMDDSFQRSQAEVARSWQARDESAHNTILYALDQRGFIDPRTGTEYDVSNKVNHAYLTSSGTLIGTTGPANLNGVIPGVDVTELPMR